jgi:hypothetical protein
VLSNSAYLFRKARTIAFHSLAVKKNLLINTKKLVNYRILRSSIVNPVKVRDLFLTTDQYLE